MGKVCPNVCVRFSSMENVVDGAYNLGRDWISSTLQRSLSEADADVRADLETKVLELWDRSYQYWVLTSVTTDQRPGPTVSKEAITNSVGEVLDKLLTSRIHANIFNCNANLCKGEHGHSHLNNGDLVDLVQG